MKFRKILLLLSFIYISQSPLFAQEIEVDEDYISEFIYGVNMNTNGGLIGGFMLKWNRIVKPKVYRSLGIDFAGIKHPKEIRNQSATGNTFIFAKRNYLFSIRPQYGRDFVLFRKAPDEGVLVSAVFAGGPSLGLLVPYYITYEYPDGELAQEQYDPAKHDNFFRILAPGGFLQGLGESQLLYGVNLKAGLSLDFGTFRNSITGVEAGFTFEIFDKIPEIMVSPFPGSRVENKQVFSAVYLTFFFGSRR